MKRFITKSLNILFPIDCTECGRYDFFSSKLAICKQCLCENKLQKDFLSSPDCIVCNCKLIGDICPYCSSRNVFFSKLYFIRLKGRFEKQIIQKIKFGNVPHLSNIFRIGLGKFIPQFKKMHYTSLIDIPSSQKTIRQRPIPVCKNTIDFLQKKLGLPLISPLLKKSKQLQSAQSFRDRFVHAQSAFELRKEFINSLKGNYLLVDDVFTTGATINEISKILLLNGANRVDVLVLVKGKN